MTLFYIESLKIFFYLLFSGLLSLIIILLSYSFSISNPYVEKISAYECGFDPYEDSRNAFDVRFYLIAILFIVFDLETCYFFP
jgi:NADH:ubiquinone oxidoreductase subunit 3 (subunit A)